MSRSHAARRYTGTRVMPFAPPHFHPGAHHHGPGFCRACGQPSGQCCCGCRECRKEAKELLFTGAAASTKPDTGETLNVNADTGALHTMGFSINTNAAAAAARNIPSAFIGGGCCVHISVEFAPIVPTAKSGVLVVVADSEGTVLGWEKIEQPGAHYTVKENIITTNPGATVRLFAVNATARIRWCEIFSC